MSNELVREPGKFQPGRLGDLLYILQVSTIRLLEMGSDHVRSGITNQEEIDVMALAIKDSLGMWLGLVPCEDFGQLLQHLGQDQILEHLRWCEKCGDIRNQQQLTENANGSKEESHQEESSKEESPREENVIRDHR